MIEAEKQIRLAENIIDYFDNSSAHLHSFYRLAFELYVEKGDVPNIKKYGNLLTDPTHMRAVVDAENNYQELTGEIAKLKRDNEVAERNYQLSHDQAQRTINALTGATVTLGIVGLLTALYLSRHRLRRVEKRLSEEEETSRQSNEIRAGLELKLSRLRRMESLGLLAGGVAHDFNNLLVGVMGNADLLRLKFEKSDENYEFTNDQVNKIIHAAETAAHLSRQMLAYAGKQQIDRKTVDLNQLVTRLTPALQSTLKDDIELTTTLWSLPLVSEVDETQIAQVLLNLVTNAVAASGNSGQIHIRTGNESLKYVDECLHGNRAIGGDFNFIEVEDFGCGISIGGIERVFEPFYSDNENGRGLGLAVVYGMVNSHDGLIRAESELGYGAKFRILIPDVLTKHSQSDDSGKPFPLAQDSLDSSRPTILIVDDQATIRELARQFLDSQGWRVLVSHDGIDAIEQMEKNKQIINCVLMDVLMPKAGALEVLQLMHERNIYLPVVLMSGFSNKKLDEFPENDLVVSFLEKPFRLNELLSTVEDAAYFQLPQKSELTQLRRVS